MESEKEQFIRLVKEMNEADYEINVKLVQAYAHILDDEITSKQIILIDLINKHGKMTVSEIAEHMQVSSSAVSQIISKLEKSDYVKREINLHNRREILVTLGERGAAYIEKEKWIEQTIIERFYSKMELQEVKRLNQLVQKLKKIVDDELEVERQQAEQAEQAGKGGKGEKLGEAGQAGKAEQTGKD